MSAYSCAFCGGTMLANLFFHLLNGLLSAVKFGILLILWCYFLQQLHELSFSDLTGIWKDLCVMHMIRCNIILESIELNKVNSSRFPFCLDFAESDICVGACQILAIEFTILKDLSAVFGGQGTLSCIACSKVAESCKLVCQ